MDQAKSKTIILAAANIAFVVASLVLREAGYVAAADGMREIMASPEYQTVMVAAAAWFLRLGVMKGGS